MTRPARLAALLVFVSACGSTPGNLAVVGSSPSSIGVGQQRVVIVELDPDSGTNLGAQGESTTATFVSPDGEEQAANLEWVWSIEGVRGFLIAQPNFAEPGQWTVEITSPRGQTEPTAFQVNSTVPLIEVGEPAPLSISRTHPEYDLTQITTDPDPDPGLYDITVAEAVTNGTPAVIVFATPAFCQTAVCGPILDTVKATMTGVEGVDVVHVEVFENIDSAGAGALVEVPAITEWGLPSEPWIYVVDASGVVTARFEGAVSVEELRRALQLAGS